MDGGRGERIVAFLAGEGLVRPRDVLRPRRSPLRSLRRVHDDAYLEALQDPQALAAILGAVPSEADADAFIDAQRTMTGGTSLAVATALAGGSPAINLGGGLHHATRERGQGFCAFNDIAVAIAGRRGTGYAERVLIVDLDLHDGEGTRSVFADDDSVFTYSVHNRDLGPTEARASLSIALGPDVDDDTYLDAIRESLPAVVREVRPGLVVYVAGVDPAWDDALGNWRVTGNALLERDRVVFETVGDAAAIAVLLGGGYGDDAWRHSARSLSRLLGGRAVDPPVDAEPGVRRFRRVFGDLSKSELTTDPSDAGWSLSEDDLMPGSRRRRFLDYYSRHGIELALERYGVLDRLRARGYRRVDLELELDDPAGHTLRLRTVDEPPVSLIELKVRRDRRTLPDAELLAVEWLLLQDPRASFGPERPALPGQRHPGLGLLRDVTAILVLICERLGLDGLSIVPTHYHVAAQTRGFFRFLDPEREGRFRALRAALRRLPLTEQARLVAEGGVIEAGSGRAVEWQPAPMVCPVGDVVRAMLDEPGYRDRAADVERATELVVPGDAMP